MTKDEKARASFEEKAIRSLEQIHWIPRGWWGTYEDARGPGSMRVKWSASGALFSGDGSWVASRGKARRIFVDRSAAIRWVQRGGK